MENLRLADEKARRGKLRSYGVKVFDRDRENNLLALHEALLTKTFKTSRYEVFTVREPKERLIYRLPYYPDRIVHHAIMNVLEPIWLKVFPYNTYSCIKGRGINGAMKRVKEILRELLSDIKTWLETELHLTLKANYQIFPIAENRYDKHGRGLDFVGFVFYHNQTQIRKGIKKNFCRTVARLNKRNPPLSPAEYKQRICSWLGWAKYSDSKHLLKSIIKPDYYGKL